MGRFVRRSAQGDRDVLVGSRAAVAGRLMAQPVYPSSGNSRAFAHLRFVPNSEVTKSLRSTGHQPKRSPGAIKKRSVGLVAAIQPPSDEQALQAKQRHDHSVLTLKWGLIICWHKHGAVVYAPARRPRRDIRSPPCQIPGVRCSARDTAIRARSVPIKSNPPIVSFIFV
jgi:hypothetical protein